MQVGNDTETTTMESAGMTAADRQDAGLPAEDHSNDTSVAGYDPNDEEGTPAPKAEETEEKSEKKPPAKKSLSERVAENAKKSATEAPAAKAESEPAETSAETPEKKPEDEYKPNFKFKYAVEGKAESQEGEIDPRFHKFITDKESEDAMRELYSKAHGLDFIKPRFMQTRQERDQFKQVVETQFQPLLSEVQQLGRAQKAGDVGSVLQMLDLPFEKVMQFVAEELKFQELTPEQQRAVAAQRQAQTRAWQAETTNNGMAQQLQTTTIRLRQMELDHALDRSEVKSLVEAVDGSHGKGSFRNWVIRLGKTYASEQNIDKPVDELVQEVAQMFKPTIPQGGTPKEDPAPKTEGQAQPGQGKPAPSTKRENPGVLPNIESRATVPTRKEVRSIKDLKKLQREMASTSLAGDED
jgi:hypothetical protein